MESKYIKAMAMIHECQQVGQKLLLPRKKYNNTFKELEKNGYIQAYKFNTYSIWLTEKGLNKCIDLMVQNKI